MFNGSTWTSNGRSFSLCRCLLLPPITWITCLDCTSQSEKRHLLSHLAWSVTCQRMVWSTSILLWMYCGAMAYALCINISVSRCHVNVVHNLTCLSWISLIKHVCLVCVTGRSRGNHKPKRYLLYQMFLTADCCLLQHPWRVKQSAARMLVESTSLASEWTFCQISVIISSSVRVCGRITWLTQGVRL